MAKAKENLKIDRILFQLGMINCFVEMVACGVKRLALSPPLSPEDYKKIEKPSNEIVNGFNIQSYLEKSLLLTDLQSEDFTRGKWSVLFFGSQSLSRMMHGLGDRDRSATSSCPNRPGMQPSLWL